MLNLQTKPFLRIENNKIIITGHFSDKVLCAKLTMLCEQYGAKLENGYAELDYNPKFLEDYEKYVNTNLQFSVLTALTLLAIALIGATAGTGASYQASEKKNQKQLKEELRKQYPDLSEAQINALVAQYGDDVTKHPFDFANWGDTSDPEAMANIIKEVDAAYSDLGYQPEAPSLEDLNKIYDDALAEYDANTNKMAALYDEAFNNSVQAYREGLSNNVQSFVDFRNQALTNEAMSQQAIAGSTRFELERQQRTAISRGASAAQRLVANINASLGLQAQSAQQALETSNVLAQNLVNHREASQRIRDSYVSAQNQHLTNRANLLQNRLENRFNYAQKAKQSALDDYNYAYDSWNEKVSNRFQGNSLGEGMYRKNYGTGGSKNQNAI